MGYSIQYIHWFSDFYLAFDPKKPLLSPNRLWILECYTQHLAALSSGDQCAWAHLTSIYASYMLQVHAIVVLLRDNSLARRLRHGNFSYNVLAAFGGP